MGWFSNIIDSLVGNTVHVHQQHRVKCWIEYHVDTYWGRHTIEEGPSLNDIARRFQREHRGVDLSCVGIYTGPKRHGDSPDGSDIPFMEGYRGNPGLVKYYNGAKP